jgi:hypothetical protein
MRRTGAGRTGPKELGRTDEHNVSPTIRTLPLGATRSITDSEHSVTNRTSSAGGAMPGRELPPPAVGAGRLRRANSRLKGVRHATQDQCHRRCCRRHHERGRQHRLDIQDMVSPGSTSWPVAQASILLTSHGRNGMTPLRQCLAFSIASILQTRLSDMSPWSSHTPSGSAAGPVVMVAGGILVTCISMAVIM